MRKIGSMSSRLMRSQVQGQEPTPEVTFSSEVKNASPSVPPSAPALGERTGSPPALGLGRASSWRVKSGTFKTKKPSCTKQDLAALCHQLKNVRESKVMELLEPGYLATIEFDNKGLSMDEIHLAAVIMLEHSAPMFAFSDRIGLQSLFDFVSSVRKVYQSNPYHDFRHAVDVMQFTNFMFHREDVKAIIHDLEDEGTRFTALVACLCHDAGHDGLTNAIHRKLPNDALVAKFGQESPLERLHFDHCQRLVLESSLLQISGLDQAQFVAQCKQLILGTDMEKHSALMGSFKANPSNYLLQMIVKIADISNVTRDFEEARTWSKRLDAEMKAHPGAAPSTITMAQSVTGFAKLFALPLACAVTEACLPETGRMLQSRIESNNDMWLRVDTGSSNPGL
ncbi:hypothetical protein BASA81_003944 [Batrachochytrium salamandrivorans]|nr:hypothetical protein BASA81_003944 [Batrachochytrium salamandrivorans]